MRRERIYLGVAAVVLVAGTAVASYSLTRLYWPCVLIGGPTVTRTVEAPCPEPEQPACPECGRQTYRDSLVDLPALPAGWTYAVNAGEDYLLAHPEGWQFVEESDDWRINGHEFVSQDGDLVVSVAGYGPKRVDGQLDIESFKLKTEAIRASGTPVDSEGYIREMLDEPAFGGHGEFEGAVYSVMLVEDREFVVRAYSISNNFESSRATVEKIVKSLRAL